MCVDLVVRKCVFFSLGVHAHICMDIDTFRSCDFQQYCNFIMLTTQVDRDVAIGWCVLNSVEIGCGREVFWDRLCSCCVQ